MPVFHGSPVTKSIESSGLDNVPTLSIESLSFTYPDGHQALRDINISMMSGEKVALVGPNGAGKSTLILHLNGILGGNGSIRVAGMSVAAPFLPQIRAMVGLVFQNPDDQFFSPTVFEDVAFGPFHIGYQESDIRTRVEQALVKVGMEKYANCLSHHLSAGEKKRIVIATVLSMEPQILVLDEPSAGLDPRARRNLINLLRELPNTMLVSTHDMRMAAELFPRMIIIDQGRVVADGSTLLLLSDTSLLEAHGLEAP